MARSIARYSTPCISSRSAKCTFDTQGVPTIPTDTDACDRGVQPSSRCERLQ